jgi:hypothetical protein
VFSGLKVALKVAGLPSRIRVSHVRRVVLGCRLCSIIDTAVLQQFPCGGAKRGNRGYQRGRTIIPALQGLAPPRFVNTSRQTASRTEVGDACGYKVDMTEEAMWRVNDLRTWHRRARTSTPWL